MVGRIVHYHRYFVTILLNQLFTGLMEECLELLRIHVIFVIFTISGRNTYETGVAEAGAQGAQLHTQYLA